MRAGKFLAFLVASSLPLVAQYSMPRGISDHLICCGPRAAGPDGTTLSADHWGTLVIAGAEAPPETPALNADPALGRSASRAPAVSPTVPVTVLSKAALEAPLEMVSGYARIGFDRLAGFTFALPTAPVVPKTPPPDVMSQVPDAIKRLDGKKVLITGFMLTLKIEKGFATEFLLLSNSQLCCYGITPAPNQWMLVKMRKEGIPPVQDVPISVAGRLRVRPQWQDGMLNGIYELEGDGLLKVPAKPAR